MGRWPRSGGRGRPRGRRRRREPVRRAGRAATVDAGSEARDRREPGAAGRCPRPRDGGPGARGSAEGLRLGGRNRLVHRPRRPTGDRGGRSTAPRQPGGRHRTHAIPLDRVRRVGTGRAPRRAAGRPRRAPSDELRARSRRVADGPRRPPVPALAGRPARQRATVVQLGPHRRRRRPLPPRDRRRAGLGRRQRRRPGALPPARVRGRDRSGARPAEPRPGPGFRDPARAPRPGDARPRLAAGRTRSRARARLSVPAPRRRRGRQRRHSHAAKPGTSCPAGRTSARRRPRRTAGRPGRSRPCTRRSRGRRS